MTTLPAVVTIVDLPLATTLSSAALFEAVQTSNGIAQSVSVSLTQIMTTGFGGLPTGGSTGQVLGKASGTNYATQWVNPSSFLSANSTSGLTITGSTSLAAALATTPGLSVLGVTGTATAGPAAIVGTSGLFLGVNAGGTGLLFRTLDLSGTTSFTGILGVPFGGIGTGSVTAFGVVYGNGTSALSSVTGTSGLPLVSQGTSVAPSFSVLGVPGGGSGTASLTAFGVVFGNGTSTVGITAAGATSLPLVGNGTASAPSFSVLTVPGGGTGTATLTAFGVIYGNATSTVGITAAGTSLFPLLANGTLAAPTFQRLNLTASVTGILTVPNGGLGISTLTTNAVLIGAGTSPISAIALVTTGFVLTSNGTTLAPTFQAAVPGTTATQADMEAGTSTSVFVSPGRQQFNQSATKGWAVFNGVGTASLSASYNVSSILRNATGDYTITWTVPFSSANYPLAGAAGGAGNACFIAPNTLATNTCRFGVLDSTGTGNDKAQISVSVSGGDQ